LFARFEHHRNDIIKALFEIVKKCPNESIILDENPVEAKIEDNGQIFQYRYKMISIQNNALMIHYADEKEMASPKYENVDDICLFSMDEIYSVVNHMKD
jgi:hypothetical protein